MKDIVNITTRKKKEKEYNAHFFLNVARHPPSNMNMTKTTSVDNQINEFKFLFKIFNLMNFIC